MPADLPRHDFAEALQPYLHDFAGALPRNPRGNAGHTGGFRPPKTTSNDLNALERSQRATGSTPKPVGGSRFSPYRAKKKEDA